MKLARRLAVHAAWLVALTAISVGLTFLLAAGATAIVGQISGQSGDTWAAIRGNVAIGTGTGLVGIPAWLLTRRPLRRLLAEAGELESASHALASLLVTGVAIIVAVQLGGSAASLGAMASTFPDESGFDQGMATLAAGALVAAIVWLTAAAARVREVGRARPAGQALGLTRLALYAPIAYCVATILAGASQASSLVPSLLDPGRGPFVGSDDPFGYAGDPSITGFLLASAVVPAAVALIALVPHAWYARRLVGPTRSYAAEETVALSRRAAWAFVGLASTGYMVTGASGVLGAGLRAVLEAGGSLTAGHPGQAAQAAGASLGLLVALVLGAISYTLHRAENRRWVADDPARAARAWGYALAWAGIGAAAMGAGQALVLLVTWISDPGRAALEGPAKAATAAPLLVAGAVAWTLAWWQAGRRLTWDLGEARSTARRAVLGATIVGSFAAIVIGLAWALTQLLDRSFGSPGELRLRELAVPISSAITGAALAAAALVAWRRDTALVATVDAGVPAIVPEPSPAPASPVVIEPAPDGPGVPGQPAAHSVEPGRPAVQQEPPPAPPPPPPSGY